MRQMKEEKKLKEFNYKFHNNVSKIDEYEKNQLTKDWE
jgi:cell division protein FtsZ